jgi:hypothetical protein
MDNEKGKIDKNWWQPAVFLFFRWSLWISLPILLGAYVGKKLDGYFGMKPFLFLLSTGIAFVFSIGYLVYNASKEYKKLDK